MSFENREARLTDVVFRSGDPETQVDHRTRVDHGLRHWVDGSMGFHRHDGVTTVVAPNGVHLARHVLAGAQWGDRPLAVDARVQHMRSRADHASGGPLYHDAARGQLLLFYHGETFADGDPTRYWSFIGLAVSDDDGATFEDLGRIVTSPVDEQGGVRPVELGAGSFVARDGWFSVYFQDRGNGPVRRRLGVARARIDDVLHAAEERRTPRFDKYCDGRWDEPGIGGRSSELLDVPWVVWFDVAVVEPLDAVLIVYSSSWLDGSVPQWMYFAALSSDGLHWSRPQPVLPAPVNDEIIYLTIDSGGPDQRVITGTSFDIYRTRASTPYRWDDAWLERITVELDSPP